MPAAVAYRLFPFERSTNKKIHATLNLLAAVLIVFGLVAVIEYHSDWGYNNFYSLHSWIGLVTATSFIAQVWLIYILLLIVLTLVQITEVYSPNEFKIHQTLRLGTVLSCGVSRFRQHQTTWAPSKLQTFAHIYGSFPAFQCDTFYRDWDCRESAFSGEIRVRWDFAMTISVWFSNNMQYRIQHKDAT